MSRNCPIMQRMKSNYENRSKTYLTRRVPVIMRLDGKAFHTYTEGLVKPFDEGLIEDMQKTAIFLCENIQGAKCAYTQSDEISILITDYDKLTTEAEFGYSVQKLTSISASFATAKFNQLRLKRFMEKIGTSCTTDPEEKKCDVYEIVERKYDKFKLAFFDSRVFSIPKHEVNNYFLARQRDAEKNSISMLAQSLYGHTELHKKNGSDMQEMCWQKGHNWNDLHFSKKRGSLIVKNSYVNDKLILGHFEKSDEYINEYIEKNYPNITTPVIKSKWEVVETPIFSQDKIIESLV